MHEPPAGLNPEDLMGVVRQSWDPCVDSLEYLAAGFGAHHWQARVAGEPAYFVTLDHVGGRHTFGSLRSAYAGAAALARSGLDFICAPRPPYLVRYAGPHVRGGRAPRPKVLTQALSLTPWLTGATVTTIDEDATVAMLARLHAVRPATLGVPLPRWQPVVRADLAAQVEGLTQRSWTGGPYGERARAALRAALRGIDRWTRRYRALGATASLQPWVPTHGEPGAHNQLSTPRGTVLVDWETLKLAPAERDLRTLGHGDRRMVEMFDLEWRLSEIREYTTWFSGTHGDSADDRAAIADLEHELAR